MDVPHLREGLVALLEHSDVDFEVRHQLRGRDGSLLNSFRLQVVIKYLTHISARAWFVDI